MKKNNIFYLTLVRVSPYTVNQNKNPSLSGDPAKKDRERREQQQNYFLEGSHAVRINRKRLSDWVKSKKNKNPKASPSQKNTVTVRYSSNSFPTLPAKGDEVIFLDKENSGLFQKGTVLSAKRGREMDLETYETRGIVKLELAVKQKESAGRGI